MERSHGLRDVLEQGSGRAEGQGGVQSNAQVSSLGTWEDHSVIGRVGLGQKAMRSLLDMGA